jgi:hypothetical protein
MGSAKRNMSTAPTSVMSKTFENYIRARERAENIAKEKVEHLNNLALSKIKNQKKAERAIRDMTSTKKQLMDTQKSRQSEALHKKDADNKHHLEVARDQQV